MVKVLICLSLPIFASSCEKDKPNTIPDDFVWDIDSFVPYTESVSVGPDSSKIATSTPIYDRKEPGIPPVQADGLSWVSLGTSLLSGSVSGIGSFISNTILTKAFSSLMESEEVKLLNRVIDKLDKMDTKIDKISEIAESTYDIVVETELNTLISAFTGVNQHLSNLSDINDYYFELLENTVAAGGDEESLKKVLNEWAHSSVNGSEAFLAVQSLAREIVQFNYKYNGSNFNYCMVFDLITYDNCPWEEVGYNIREMYRASASTVLAKSLYLSAAFYKMSNTTKSLDNLLDCARTLESYFKACNVVRHNNLAICQIKGAHFSVDRNALVKKSGFGWDTSLEIRERAITPKQAVAAEGLLLTPPSASEVDAYLASQLTNAEVKAIMSYYQAIHPYDYTLIDCFAEGGMVISDEFVSEYTMIPGTDEVQSLSEIYFGTAETNITIYCENDPDKHTSEGWHFGVLNSFQAGIPVGSCRGHMKLWTFDIPVYPAWVPIPVIDDPDHPARSTIGLPVYDFHKASDGFYYYDKWYLREEPPYSYPGTYIMLKKGSLSRY